MFQAQLMTIFPAFLFVVSSLTLCSIMYTPRGLGHLCLSSWVLCSVMYTPSPVRIFSVTMFQFVHTRGASSPVIFLPGIMLHCVHVGPKCSTLIQHCTNIIQMFCVYWRLTWAPISSWHHVPLCTDQYDLKPCVSSVNEEERNSIDS